MVVTFDESLVGLLSNMVPAFFERFERFDAALSISIGSMREIIASASQHLSSLHHVSVPPEIVSTAAAIAPRLTGHVQPGLGISTIDSACVRARMRRSAEVEVQDLRGDIVVNTTLDHERLAGDLAGSVIGQDHVVATVASRLALTHAGLDVRPERPNGVFLFVGPTGVGKTEMARAVSRSLFGSVERMIRLDMSEYAHDWAISRLIGPMPGYVGSTEPASWLTTRIAKQPACVLLLDEVEKAHPAVWNTFLQAFDAGRLTDSRGEVADFSEVVVIMTSNLGARAYRGRTPIGFRDAGAHDDTIDAEVAHEIRAALSPELINRLDDILYFRPLSREAIRTIAAMLIDAQVQRTAAMGYALDVGDEVIDFIAETGYDPAFGARHLQRNLERKLLAPLALAQGQRSFRAELHDGGVRWIPA
jgi:ATP-dependent Clp protease ATP-binding subunit ClpA